MSKSKVSEELVEVPTPEIIEPDTSEVDVLLSVQSFFQKFGKQLLTGVGAIVVVGGGIFAYGEFVTKPKEEKAADIIYKAQQFFAQDSSKKVLDGDGTSKGVLYVINEYSGTKAANLAHYYAGISYLKLGEFDKAISQLKDFKTDALQIQMVAYGALGDAYSEAGKKDEALDYYLKAAKTFEKDENASAEYLFRAGLLSETLNKDDKALAYYKELKEKYPKSEKASQIDKYINKLSNEKPEL